MVSGIGGSSSLDYMYTIQGMQKDKELSADELFNTVDTDGDGAISKGEFEKHRNQKAQNPMASLMNFLNGSVQIGSMDEIISAAASGGLVSQERGPSIDEILNKMDTDGDGNISQAEFMAGGPMGASQRGRSAEQIFNKIDTDGDGSISKDEFEEHRVERGRGHRGHPPDSQEEMAAILDSLQVSPDEGSTTNSSSDQTGMNGLASFLEQALDKYFQSAYAGGNTTSSGLVNTVG